MFNLDCVKLKHISEAWSVTQLVTRDSERVRENGNGYEVFLKKYSPSEYYPQSLPLANTGRPTNTTVPRPLPPACKVLHHWLLYKRGRGSRKSQMASELKRSSPPITALGFKPPGLAIDPVSGVCLITKFASLTQFSSRPNIYSLISAKSWPKTLINYTNHPVFCCNYLSLSFIPRKTVLSVRLFDCPL